MIKAVLFDLFETLISESEDPPARASSLGEALGLDGAAFRREWRSERPRVVRGQLSFHNALMKIGTALALALDPAVVKCVCDQRIREKAAVFQRIEPELLALTRELRQQGIPLAVVSNCFAEDVTSWPACALAPQFSSTVFSFAVGLVKPEAGIYLAATRQLGVDPGDALFIGDGADDELEGAERVGLRAAQAVWFRGSRPDASASAAAPRVASRQDVLRLVAAG